MGAVQRLELGLCRLQEAQEEPCHASCPQGHCSGAWAAPPAAATDLQHSFLPAPINLLFRSAWHQSLPHLGDAMSSHLMRTFLFTLFHTSVPGSATGVLCHVGHLLCLTIPQFPLLLHSQLRFRDKGTQTVLEFSTAGIGFGVQTGTQAAALFEALWCKA